MNHFRVFIRNANPITQFFLLIAVTLFATGLVGSLGLLVAETLFGANWETIQSYLSDPSQPGASGVLKALQLFNTLGIFLIPAMLFSQIFSAQPNVYLRLNRGFSLQILAAIVVLFVAFIPITDALSWLNNLVTLPSFLADFETGMRQSTEQMQSLIGSFMQMDSFGAFLFNLFLMAALPALGEEFFFRGVLQRLLISRTGRVHLSVWITGLAFGLMHQQFFGIIPLVILGALLGYLKEWTGSLWASILAHFVNNAAIVVVMYFSNYDMSDLSELTSPDLLYLIPAVVICGGLIFFLFKNRIAPLPENDDVLDIPENHEGI